MHRLAFFSALAVLAMWTHPGGAQPRARGGGSAIRHEGDGWVRMFTGTVAPEARLRVIGHGPVTLHGGGRGNLIYSVKVKVEARRESEARRALDAASVRIERERGQLVLTVPGGAALSTVTLTGPRFEAVTIGTSDGAVDARGVNGPLNVTSGAGEIFADRVAGACSLATGGGDVRVGDVQAGLHCTTGAGRITVNSAGGETVLETNGGDIIAGRISASVKAQTGAGRVQIHSAGGAVNAITGGGEIVVDQAAGIVTVRNMAGPVQVGASEGVQCENGSGGIRLGNVTGAMRVSTAMGSIFANLLGSRLRDSYLATGNGDITVIIPSNVGVTIRAANQMGDTIRRIVSDFPSIQSRRRGTQVIAEGSVNGGGPLLQINGTGGTIYIRHP